MKQSNWTPRIGIRQVGSEELPQLRDLAHSTFAEAFGKVNDPEDMKVYLQESFGLDNVRKELEDPESRFFFGTIEGKEIAYLKLNKGDAQTGDYFQNSLEVERIYVVGSYQGMHIGKLLMDHAIHIGQKEKFENIWLGVWDQNKRAIRFYERLGFSKFGTHKFKLGNDRQTDILMKLEL